MWINDIWEEDERDACRRFAVELWTRLRVPENEIARRLSITVATLGADYGNEMRAGPKKWTARAMLDLADRAKAGEAEVGLQCLVVTLFEHEPIARMLAPSSTQRTSAGDTVH